MRPGDEVAGRYVFKEVVGAGRSGDVWLVHDTLIDQYVAAKPGRAASARGSGARHLLDEPRALAKFRDHPHVVTLFDVLPASEVADAASDGVADGGGADGGVADGDGAAARTEGDGGDRPGARTETGGATGGGATTTGGGTTADDGGGAGEQAYWFVMEYVSGGSLDRLPPMSPRQAARIGVELADALASLHDNGVVHCDIKPANVGLSRRGTAMLLDFGAAHRVDGTATAVAEGPFSFTPDYAAPELAMGDEPRPASDVFCLAATLYALVTGSPPRGGQTTVGTGREGARGPGPVTERLSYWMAERGVVEIDADAVGPLQPVLAAMLRHDPARRPAAAEAGRLLAAVAAGSAPASDRTAPRPAERVRQRLAAALTLGATVAAAVTAGVALLPGDGTGTGARGAAGARGTSSPDNAVDGTAHRGRTGGAGAPGDGAPDGTAGSPVGDPRTADLRALVDPAALGPFGAAERAPELGDFDRCALRVHTGGGSRVEVAVRLRAGTPPEDGGTRQGDRLPTREGEFGGAATPHAVADRATAGTPAAGPSPRRSPADPLTCALLDDRTLAAVATLRTR
ncbi:serine/threonine-protein kinase [Streptomyces sp. Z26]|uniref:serine/threonine-protein kinase n=1 Tax=Streptomyces sp. Z26 TaxID=2500177 RepID=UPI001F0B9C9A|nr:serine/threonine-protein kinase [Streptomyces sp. Z26]